MIVVDSSVAVKWVVAEERRAEARLVLASGLMLDAPDFMLLEVTSALRKKMRRKEIVAEQMDAGLNLIRQAVTLLSTRSYVDEAIALSSTLDHSVYDCCFLACAKQQGDLLVSDDEIFVKKCRAADLGEHVLALAEVSHGGLERALEQVPRVDPFSSLETN